MKIGSVPAASTATINLTYVPQFLLIKTPGVAPGVAVKVTAIGDGVLADLDWDGVKALDAIRGVSDLAGVEQLALADGLVAGKNCEIVITNASATDAVDVFAFSQKKGTSYVRSLRNTVLANSGQQFENFAYMGLPAFVTGEIINVTYVDGTNQQLDIEDLKGQTAFNQGVPGQNIDNLDGMIDLVVLIPTANRTAYVVTFEPVGNLG